MSFIFNLPFYSMNIANMLYLFHWGESKGNTFLCRDGNMTLWILSGFSCSSPAGICLRIDVFCQCSCKSKDSPLWLKMKFNVVSKTIYTQKSNTLIVVSHASNGHFYGSPCMLGASCIFHWCTHNCYIWSLKWTCINIIQGYPMLLTPITRFRQQGVCMGCPNLIC